MISVDAVSKFYGLHPAVQDLSFRIDGGQVVGLLGLNGAGKSTTLRILSGLIVPTSGRVVIDGVSMVEEPEALRARIGFLPEVPPLYPDMRVEEYLRFVAHIKGVTQGVNEAVQGALGAADLVAVRQDLIGTLSHGYQRRVGIAQAIVHRPALILLDEPTSGLDPRQIVHMRELIRNLRQRHTVLVSSHVLAEIHALCDRIFVLNQGRIVAEGTEEQLSKRVAHTTSVRVEVQGGVEALKNALATCPGVTSHVIEGQGKESTVARVDLGSDGRAALAEHLVQAGLGLLTLEPVKLELENIFLQLTKDTNDPKDAVEEAA